MVKYALNVDSVTECAALCLETNYPLTVPDCRSFTYGTTM